MISLKDVFICCISFCEIDKIHTTLVMEIKEMISTYPRIGEILILIDCRHKFIKFMILSSIKYFKLRIIDHSNFGEISLLQTKALYYCSIDRLQHSVFHNFHFETFQLFEIS